jgi:CLIP-associating protein 1/2
MSELSNTLGHAFDPFLPDYLSHTLSMAGQTKKLVATASQSAVTALLTNSAYHLKTIQLLWTGMNDKIVLARTFVSAHLLTFVQIHGKKSRASIESSGGWDVVELCLKKGLADSNSVVKENCRKTYWEVAQVHEATSKKVWEGLDAQSRKALEKVEPGKGKEEGEPEKGKVARPSVRQMMAAKARASLQPAQVVDTLDGSPQQRSRTVSAPFPSTSPIATRPTTKLQGELDTLAGPTNASSDLLGLAPPFALADDKDPSLAFSSTSTPSRSRNHALVLPVTEPIVDDALRDQASQAEQAAERLLELAEDEQSHAADEAGGATTPLPLFQRTPVTKRTVHLNGFEDSPDVRGSGFAGTGRGNWWMKQQPGRESHLNCIHNIN